MFCWEEIRRRVTERSAPSAGSTSTRLISRPQMIFNAFLIIPQSLIMACPNKICEARNQSLPEQAVSEYCNVSTATNELSRAFLLMKPVSDLLEYIKTTFRNFLTTDHLIMEDWEISAIEAIPQTPALPHRIGDCVRGDTRSFCENIGRLWTWRPKL